MRNLKFHAARLCTAGLCALLALCLPAAAQSVRYQWQGQAHIVAEQMAVVESIIDRVLGPQASDRSQIVFYRPVGRGVTGEVPLHRDGILVAQLPVGAYYFIVVPPGSYTFALEGDPLVLDAGPGTRHYIKVSSDPANPRLWPMHAEAFLYMATGKRKPLT